MAQRSNEIINSDQNLSNYKFEVRRSDERDEREECESEESRQLQANCNV